MNEVTDLKIPLLIEAIHMWYNFPLYEIGIKNTAIYIDRSISDDIEWTHLLKLKKKDENKNIKKDKNQNQISTDIVCRESVLGEDWWWAYRPPDWAHHEAAWGSRRHTGRLSVRTQP